MKENDIKNQRIRGFISNIPKAVAAAILSSAIAALLAANVLPEESRRFVLAAVMLLCAAVSVFIETVRLPKAVHVIIPLVSAICGAACLFVPRGDAGQSLFLTIMNGSSAADALIIPFICVCFVLCSLVSAINGSYVLRCAAAGSIAVFLIVLALMKTELIAPVLVLLLAYILIVACQVFAPSDDEDGSAGHDSWHVLLCVLAAVIAVSLPTPSTRIPWEKLLHIHGSEQLENIGDVLDIDAIEQQSAASMSGYDEDMSSLGGWLELSNAQPIEISFPDGVRTDRIDGSIYDSYTGKGWLCTITLTGTGYVSSSDAFSSNASVTDNGGSSAVVRRIRDRSETLFIPPQTVRVESADGSDPVRSASRLVLPDSGRAGYTYTAYFGEDPTNCALSSSEREAYLELPGELPTRVREFAALLTSGKESDMDKANAIMNTLSLYKYNTQVSDIPAESDFVDHFLFETREGYCEYFASSMAVLARCVNIPSRYVIGYAVPNDGSDTVRISDANAHAWAELYIDGQGWVVFDPAADTSAFEVHTLTQKQTDETDDCSSDGAVRKMLLYSYSAIAGLALLFLIFRPIFKRTVSGIRLAQKHRSKAGYDVLRRCHKALWVLASCGVARSADETPQEFCRRVISECDWLTPDAAGQLGSLMAQCEKALYSREVSFTQVRSAARAVKRSFIKSNGLFRYIRGWWRADGQCLRQQGDAA